MKNLDSAPLVVVDLETSGVNPFRHDVLALALVPLNSELRPHVVFVKPPEIRWTEYARANFAKFAAEWERNAVAPVEACASIESYLRNTFGDQPATPIGHNIGFDVAFLRKLAFLGNRDELPSLSHRAIDTHTLLYVLAASGRIPSSAVSSTGAFEHFGITVSESVRHTALGDAVATRELFLRLVEFL